eukprot:m.501086 g.501086  ORF g.501086 m.501086 type:complete len:153 (-) comp62947_c0_seq1:194-652(-)
MTEAVNIVTRFLLGSKLGGSLTVGELRDLVGKKHKDKLPALKLVHRALFSRQTKLRSTVKRNIRERRSAMTSSAPAHGGLGIDSAIKKLESREAELKHELEALETASAEAEAVVKDLADRFDPAVFAAALPQTIDLKAAQDLFDTVAALADT